MLRDYLHFAEYGASVLPVQSKLDLDTSPSEVSKSIADALVLLGYKVHFAIGSSHYRIDLAVIDPANPERYILGIELDGPNYLSAVTVRERDRLRHQVLTSLGWNLYRVWSLEWLRSRDAVISQLILALDALTLRPERSSEPHLDPFTLSGPIRTPKVASPFPAADSSPLFWPQPAPIPPNPALVKQPLPALLGPEIWQVPDWIIDREVRRIHNRFPDLDIEIIARELGDLWGYSIIGPTVRGIAQRSFARVLQSTDKRHSVNGDSPPRRSAESSERRNLGISRVKSLEPLENFLDSLGSSELRLFQQ